MRVNLKAAIAATLVLTPLAGQAAPMSMLQSLPQGSESAPAEATGKPGRMAWLTKWLGNKPATQPMAITRPQGTYPPTMAYQPASEPMRSATNGTWGTASPAQSLAVTTAEPTIVAPNGSTTPITSVQPFNGLPSVGAVTARPSQAAVTAKSLREQGHEKDREGQLTVAEDLYRQAIGADPTSAAAVNDLGLCLARQGKLPTSIATLRQAIMMRPDKPLYRNNIATVLVEVGETEEALAHLKTAYGPAAAHHNLGQLLSRAGQTDAAIVQLNQALKLEPSMAPARNALAQLTAATQPMPASAEPTPPQMAQSPNVSNAPGTPTLAVPMSPSYAPAQVAVAPQHMQTVTEEPSGAPTFPRLLPPVINR